MRTLLVAGFSICTVIFPFSFHGTYASMRRCMSIIKKNIQMLVFDSAGGILNRERLDMLVVI